MVMLVGDNGKKKKRGSDSSETRNTGNTEKTKKHSPGVTLTCATAPGFVRAYGLAVGSQNLTVRSAVAVQRYKHIFMER